MRPLRMAGCNSSAKKWTSFLTAPHAQSDHYVGWVKRDSFTDFLASFELETSTKFVSTWSAHSKFGNTDIYDQKHFVRYEDDTIPYDGTPFMVVNVKKLSCQHGTDMHASHKAKREKSLAENGDHAVPKKRKKMVQSSYKFDCGAKIVVKEVVRFPDFKLGVDTVRNRKATSTNVKESMKNGNAGYHTTFFVTLPKMSDHNTHHIGEGASMLLFTDNRIIKQIHEYVITDNVRQVSTIKKLVTNFVRTKLFSDSELPPITNRRYWPTNNDIRNHMHRAIMATRFNEHDQENLIEKIKVWKKHNAADNFFFRPSRLIDSNEYSSDGLLFVHQTAWQRRLLHKYGQELCLLDATYKTTKYSLPLFFICVRTNVGYQIVAEFICQDETSNSITEALQMLLLWNPSWKPSHFMTDFCEAEINALERTFINIKVLICDFHREQCWERWCKKLSNEVQQYKAEILSRLRRCARASSIEDFEIAVISLKDSDVWINSKKLQNWFEKSWLPQAKRWVWAYRKDDLSFIINTNNGIERQNEAFKHQYLQQNIGHSTLSNTVTILLEDFLPDKYRSYVSLNTSFSSLARRYSPQVPEYLRNRPRDFTMHCMKRIVEAEYASEGYVVVEEGYSYTVKSSEDSNVWYTVSFGDDSTLPSCECWDYQSSKWPCKHFFAVLNHVSDLSWVNLSCKFRSHPLINLDEDILFAGGKIQTITPGAAHECDVDDVSEDCTQSVDHNNQEKAEENERITSIESKSFEAEAAACRELLCEIKSYTFLITKHNSLNEVKNILSNALELCKINTECDNGQPLLLKKKKENPKKDKTHKKVYSDPPLSFHKKHPFSGRYGEKATIMRSNYHSKLDVTLDEWGKSKDELNVQESPIDNIVDVTEDILLEEPTDMTREDCTTVNVPWSHGASL